MHLQRLSLALLSTIIISLISLIGIFTVTIKDKILFKILIFLVAFSAGALIGGAFFHLLPEALSTQTIENVSIFLLIGFCAFFLLEKILHWRHCHEKGDCKIHPFSYLNLVGDSIHNFIDGLVIASSFYVDQSLGISTSLAIIAHEIPQEIGDFAILIHGGMNKKKALIYNYISAFFAIFGAVFGFILIEQINNLSNFLLPFTAGGFIYIAASDLIPELHKEKSFKKSILAFIFFLAGLIFMYFTKKWLE
ncbi:ZIP family metal transporter [Candidatus Beckwithbacteria bacterium]|nr:ZIP family metal transporter [Candidatus Beckwithbacteria bacterium]